MFTDLSGRDAPGPGMPHFSGRPELCPGQLHEVHASLPDWAGAMAFALHAPGVSRQAPLVQGPLVLVRTTRRPASGMRLYGEGLAGLGIDPARLLIIEANDDTGLLRAALDAARCGGLSGLVLETWGAMAGYDLTASRRLVLAAERSRVPIMVLRGDARPRASAAHTRWQVCCAPSTALPGNAPGMSVIEVELLRRRGGPAGMRWWLEWNGEDGTFRERRAGTGQAAAPSSGAVVSLSAVRAGASRNRAA